MYRKIIDIFYGIKIFFFRQFLNSVFSDFNKYHKFFLNQVALEIGGPTNLFKKNGGLPIYPLLKRLDGCNFNTKTVWEKNIHKRKSYYYGSKQSGFQYIAEATNLNKIKNNKYDLILASHILEHISNPILAIKEWLRVLKKNGLILIVVPDSKYTFDHKRKVTTFKHLMYDFKNRTKETDQTHVAEVLKYNNFFLDGSFKNYQEFELRCKNNIDYRTLHHHVFNLYLIKKIYRYFRIKLIFSVSIKPYHLAICGRKIY